MLILADPPGRASPAGQQVSVVGAAAAQALVTAPSASARSEVAPVITQEHSSAAVTTSAATPTATPAATTAGGGAASSGAIRPTPLPARPSADRSISKPPVTSPRRPPARPAPGPTPAPATHAASAPSTVATPVPAPAAVRLPTLGVSAPVVPTGADARGAIEIPTDVGTVGWYRYGPPPGSAKGSAVLTGHVDDHIQGVGVFARIGDLAPGDPVQMVDAAGTTRRFTVISREQWHKQAVPYARLFDLGGAPRLVLMTCGGDFDQSTLSYTDNIAITAVPAGS